jgi:hypothetical protein
MEAPTPLAHPVTPQSPTVSTTTPAILFAEPQTGSDIPPILQCACGAIYTARLVMNSPTTAPLAVPRAHMLLIFTSTIH